jgi:hypothetical protein
MTDIEFIGYHRRRREAARTRRHWFFGYYGNQRERRWGRRHCTAVIAQRMHAMAARTL